MLKHTEFFFQVTRTHTKILGLRQDFSTPDPKLYPSLENVLLLYSIVIDSKPKVKSELQTAIENSANLKS